MSTEYDLAPYCSCCLKPCDYKWEDHGVGHNEFWGFVSHHTDMVAVSTCCGEDMLRDPTGPDDYSNRWYPKKW